MHKLPEEFWRVYNRIADHWYRLEYGQIETPERWYHPAMLFLEHFAAEMNR